METLTSAELNGQTFNTYQSVSSRGKNGSRFQYFKNDSSKVDSHNPPGENLRVCTHDSVIHAIYLPKLFELGVERVTTNSVIGEIIGHSAISLSKEYKSYLQIKPNTGDLEFALQLINYPLDQKLKIIELFNACSSLSKLIGSKDKVFTSIFDKTTKELTNDEIESRQCDDEEYSQEVIFSSDSHDIRSDMQIQLAVARINLLINGFDSQLK